MSFRPLDQRRASDLLGLGVGSHRLCHGYGIAFLLHAVSLLPALTMGHPSGRWFAFTLVLSFFTRGDSCSSQPRSIIISAPAMTMSNYAVLDIPKASA